MVNTRCTSRGGGEGIQNTPVRGIVGRGRIGTGGRGTGLRGRDVVGRSRDAVGEVDPGAGDERREDENVNVHDQSSSEDEGLPQKQSRRPDGGNRTVKLWIMEHLNKRQLRRLWCAISKEGNTDLS
jgi:hypothetical protein